MAIFRRGKWWWTDFSLNGVRYRQPIRDERGQRTKDWREALSREKELIAQAQSGKLSAGGQSFARLAFSEAAERYLADRVAHLAQRSIRTEGERLKPICTFFGSMPLSRISTDSVREYIGHRKQREAANRTINMEIGILRRMLKRAKRWHLMADEIPHLPERCDIGRALSFEEKARLLRMAGAKPEWDTARLAAILTLNTTMRGCELKGLRWRAVDFMERTITVRRTTTKTDAGERLIPMNPDAWAAAGLVRLSARGGEEQARSDNADEWMALGLAQPDPGNSVF